MKELKEIIISSSNRNFGIDVLRGLSILFVIVHHLAMNFRLPLQPSYIGNILSSRIIKGISFHGYEAVFLFFVLSGFLITQRSLAQYKILSKINLRRFYIQRFSRIFPLLALLLVTLSLLHGFGIPGYVVSEHDQTLWRALLSALGLHLNWYEAQTSWLPAAWDVLWSLSIEEVFYLAFPLLCLFLPQWLFITVLVLLAFSLPWTRAALADNEIWQEKAYLPGMAAIAFGVLAAMLTNRLQISKPLAKLFTFLGSLGLLGVFFYDEILWRILHDHIMLVLCLSACFLVLAAHRLQPLPIRGLGWLAKMGYLSYELYLCHMFIVLSVCSAYRSIFGEDMAWSFAVYIPSLFGCYWLAALLEKWVSKPSASWLRSNFE